MVDYVVTALLLVVAVIHILPISGFFGVERIASLYEIEIADRNTEILMRHRAMLFGILGVFLAYAAFTPAVQPIAFIAAFFSIASFFYLTFSVGGYNGAIRKVVIADVVAAVCLAGAIVLYFATG